MKTNNFYSSSPFGSLIQFLVPLFSMSVVLLLFIIFKESFFNKNNIFFILLFMGFIDSFIGLPTIGCYLNKHCSNNDLEKCKKCSNWNCHRLDYKRAKRGS